MKIFDYALTDLDMYTSTVNNDICNSSELFLNEILDNCIAGIYVTDKKGKIIYTNIRAAKYYGCTKKELLSMTSDDLVKKKLTNRSLPSETLKTKKCITALTYNLDGEEYLTNSRPIFDENKKLIMIINFSLKKSFMNIFISSAEREKINSYKQVLEYLGHSVLPKNSIIAVDPKMIQLLDDCRVIAKTDSTVIIYGESGTGKEIIARHIYTESLRNNEPFIPINCAAIPNELMESEFFGYTKGSFTGAISSGKPGIFELADKGTLFLDEIAELPLDLQSKLLRVLDSGEIFRIGDIAPKQTNVRVIAATNKDLSQLVEEGKFREDLYYRLNVIPVTIPPLRERPEDILPLAEYFLNNYNRKYLKNVKLSESLISAYQHYPWPGNIRELNNVIQRLVITANTGFSTATYNIQNEVIENSNNGSSTSLGDAVSDFEKRYIKEAITNSKNMTEAAAKLGIHRSYLYKKMSTLNITV